jgi:hypothetical protein
MINEIRGNGEDKLLKERVRPWARLEFQRKLANWAIQLKFTLEQDIQANQHIDVAYVCRHFG